MAASTFSPTSGTPFGAAFGPALAAELAAAADRLRAVTVAVHAGAPTRRGPAAGQGSGVLWRAPGVDPAGGDRVVVTNAHVARAEHAVVTLPDGRRVAARLVARDPGRDLALLALGADPAALGALAAAAPGEPARLRAGEVVLAFGHPLGLANALAAGVVHAAGAARGPWAPGPGGVRVVRADVRLLPGNSGGPLADAAGRVVGINAMVVNGLGVAISADEVADLVRRAQRGARPDAWGRAA